ncbi:MAG: RdgB/HAM1 family non-canonical purine NTP pyrophosphatase [Candidatus Wallbacteria bacterium]|nr:RdgB/HAM1 family non-canonical purine NTP pyrophosphatase [Candidatus Wallbacteria bacterium]
MRFSTLLVATHNAGKLREIREVLGGWVGELRAQTQVPDAPPPADETADTYQGNALLKAEALHAATGLPTMADDSGLEVAALGGRPGLHSSRYGTSDGDRIRRLLEELAGVPEPDRGARFVCVVALALPGGARHFFEGVCPGSILTAPRGAGGFGFDPVFLVEGLDRSMAELPIGRKNQLSHRARALAALRDWMARD